ncbi:hypothetical protein ACIRIR_11340 [Streptomyces globisporus]|uniref:hypothetical protein n=1 Tax=Streptomyces globisporus TaxID=1908 RepID=UPI003830D813
MLPPTPLGTPGRLITGAGEFDRPGPQGGQGRQDGGARGQEGGGPDDGAGHGPRHHDGGRDAQQRQRAPHDQQVHRGDHAPEHRAHPDRLGDDEPQDLRDAGPGETEHGEIAAPSGGGPDQGVARAVAVESRAMPRIIRRPVRVRSSGLVSAGASHAARVATRVPVSAAAVSSAAATRPRPRAPGLTVIPSRLHDSIN